MSFCKFYLKEETFYILHFYTSMWNVQCVLCILLFYCSTFLMLTISHQMSLSQNIIDSVCLTYVFTDNNSECDGLSMLRTSLVAQTISVTQNRHTVQLPAICSYELSCLLNEHVTYICAVHPVFIWLFWNIAHSPQHNLHGILFHLNKCIQYSWQPFNSVNTYTKSIRK